MNSGSQSGTVAFLFTDIEGSTRLWEQEPERIGPALARHDAIARAAVAGHHGMVVKMTGDGMDAAFEDPLAAVRAALELQAKLADSDATEGLLLRVRCGIHVGVVERRDNDFFGSVVNRAARIMGAAHGGQILLSQAVATQVGERLPAGVTLRDLGFVRLRDLSSPERVYQIVHPQLRQDFPPLCSLEATPNNLPQQLTSFVGRDREMGEVKQLLSTARLLTLLGPGGIGKTRLALQVAADAIDSFLDGVWFVDFGPVRDPSIVPTAVAQVLGIAERAGAPLVEALCRHLRSRQMLILFDNCEHLVDACADLANTLLTAAPGIRILATSREPLRLTGEQCLPLSSLSFPDPRADSGSSASSDAVQLFIERARSHQPAFALTARNALVVALICARLDGIPLALELAAARVPSLSIETINARLNDRFKLLTAGTRTAVPRQQTLRATLDWSYDLLTPLERTILNRLSVFAGTFTLEAASAVASDGGTDEFAAIDVLAQLVARSLVQADTNAAGTRYRLLETTRVYAHEKLADAGQTGTIERLHAQYYRKLFEQASEDWLRMSDADWRAAYLPEVDNVRTALDWALGAAGDPAIGVALAGASGPMWPGLALYSEGKQRLEAALAHVGAQTPELEQAYLWFRLGWLSTLATPAQSVAVFERAVDLFRRLGDAPGLGFSLVYLAYPLARMDRLEQAQQTLDEAYPVLEHLGLPKALARYYHCLAFLKELAGDQASARLHYEKALVLCRDVGSEALALAILGHLANMTWAQGDLDSALAGFREAAALMRKAPIMVKATLGLNLTNLAGVLTERGDLAEALPVMREGLPLLRDVGNAWINMDHVALQTALAGMLPNAARLAGYANATYAAKQTSRQPNEARAHERLQQLLRERLDPSELTGFLAEGATLNEDEACRLALAE